MTILFLPSFALTLGFMNTIISFLAFSFAFGSDSRPAVNLALEFDIEGISRRGISVGLDAEPVILNGVDLNSLVLIERPTGKYYVTLRGGIPSIETEWHQLTWIGFEGRNAPLPIAFDLDISPSPSFTVGFLEGIFRHFSGLPMKENPSLEEITFVPLAPDLQGDDTFGDLPVGSLNMDSIRGSLANSDRRLDSLTNLRLVVLRFSILTVITRADWLFDSSHTRFVFRRFLEVVPSMGVSAPVFYSTLIDARVWNEDSAVELSRLALAYTNSPAGQVDMRRIKSANLPFVRFLVGLDLYRSGSGPGNKLMRPIESIKCVDGGPSDTFYEIVLKD